MAEKMTTAERMFADKLAHAQISHHESESGSALANGRADFGRKAAETKALNVLSKLIVPDGVQFFSGDSFRWLRKPGVYLFLLKGKTLYIGLSEMLLGRVGTRHKQAQRAIDECDQVILCPCIGNKSYAARHLEKILINKLRPKYNKRMASLPAAEQMSFVNGDHLQQYVTRLAGVPIVQVKELAKVRT